MDGRIDMSLVVFAIVLVLAGWWLFFYLRRRSALRRRASGAHGESRKAEKSVQGPSPSVFISYARPDSKIAKGLADDLTARGYDVWWDVNLVGSDEFREVIQTRLRAAKAVIVIWSLRSVASRFVRQEADEALHFGKLISTRVRGLEVMEIPIGFREQHADYVDDRNKVVAALQKLVSEPSSPARREDHAKTLTEADSIAGSADITNIDEADPFIEEHKRAIGELDAIVLLDSTNVDAYYRRGCQYYELGHYKDYPNAFDRAISDFDKVIQLDPKHFDAYRDRGLCYRRRGDFDRALSDAEKMIEIAPARPTGYDHRAAVYRKKGEIDRAIADLDRAILIESTNYGYYYDRAEAFRAKGELERAIEDYREVLELSPGHHWAEVYVRQLSKRLTNDKRNGQNATQGSVHGASVENDHPYDWYNDIGFKDFSELKVGSRVLYEEQSLLPDMDEPYYKQLRKIKLHDNPFKVSPRGFVLLEKRDHDWHDPRDRNRRIYCGFLATVTPDGEVALSVASNPQSRRMIVDVLPDEWFVAGSKNDLG